MLSLIYRAAAAWTVIGLGSGLFYRELTRDREIGSGTQLAVVHTHTLTLGTLFMLILLALVGVWPRLAARRSFRAGFWAWQVGLLLTAGGLLVKGCLQVLESANADSKALAGVSGLGHIALTVAFVLLFVGLAPVVRDSAVATANDDASALEPTGR